MKTRHSVLQFLKNKSSLLLIGLLMLGSILAFPNTASTQPKSTAPNQLADLVQAKNLRAKADKLYFQDAKQAKKDDEKKKLTQAAIEQYQAALKIYDKAGDAKNAALLSNNIAELFWGLNNYQESLSFYQQTLKYVQTNQDIFWQVITLQNIATNYQQLEDLDRALEYHQQTLALLDSPAMLQLQNGLSGKHVQSFAIRFITSTNGGSFLRSGDLMLEKDEFLTPANLVYLRITQLTSLSNLFLLYQGTGDEQQALEVFSRLEQQVIQVEADLKQVPGSFNPDLVAGMSGTMNWLRGYLYSQIGDEDAAQASFAQAVPQSKRFVNAVVSGSKDSAFQGLVTNYLPFLISLFVSLSQDSSNKFELDPKQVATVLEVIDSIEKTKSPDIDISSEGKAILAPYAKYLEPVYHYYKGQQFAQAGQSEQAIAAYNRALAGWQTSPNINFGNLLNAQTTAALQEGMLGFKMQSQWKTQQALGKTYAQMGQPQQAIAAYNQALKLTETTKQTSNSQWTNFVIGPSERAETLFQLGKIFAANQPNAAIEAFQGVITLQPSLKKILLASNARWELALLERQRNNLAAAQTQIEQAIAIIESQQPQPTQAKTSGKPSRQSRYRSYIDLVDYLDSKRNYYDFYADLLMQQHQQSPKAGYDVLAFQAVERSRARSLRTLRYSNPQTTISTTEKQALQTSLNASLKYVQARLPKDTVLLSYSLGDRQSYLWVVSASTFQSYPLPPRSTIEKAVRQFQRSINAKSYPTTRGLQIAQVQPSQPQPAPAKQQLDSLSPILLDPILPLLNNQFKNHRLIITTDGALQYVPFAALRQPKSDQAQNSKPPNGQSQDSQPLLVNHEIIGLPSAFMLGFSSQQRPTKPQKTLAMFADPIYSGADDRAKGITQKPANVFYDRLPGTRQEAAAISNLIPADQQWINLDFAANYANATSPNLNQYRLIHFATHGQFDSEKPQRSGMVFSAMNDRGIPRRGLFSTVDAFNLELSADLVVLSGCTTALGQEIRGEGLIGLTGGFLYAGSKQVVASLWDVDDFATAELMTQFYTGMLKQGLTPTAALRQAQLQLWNSGQWQQPYYWSAFVIHGM